MTPTATSGTAQSQGPLWGSRPIDWAEVEAQEAPAYEETIRRVGVDPGDAVLDLGCGAGTFLGLAADRGARPFGLDAAERLVELARERVPGADIRVGDLESLPWADDSFDLVTGFCSFFFAGDMVAALREAGRVAKPGAPVVIQVWGRPERCDLRPMLDALRALRGEAPGAPTLAQPGVLEGIASQAGLEARYAFDMSYGFEHADEETLVRHQLSPGPVQLAVAEAGEERVGSAIAGALAPFRRPDGSYRLENEWHFLIAHAS